MGEFSLTHILLVAVIFLIFFGPNKLPALGQSLGKAIRGFKDGLNEIEVKSTDVTHVKTETPKEGTRSQSQNLSGPSTNTVSNMDSQEVKKPEPHS